MGIYEGFNPLTHWENLLVSGEDQFDRNRVEGSEEEEEEEGGGEEEGVTDSEEDDLVFQQADFPYQQGPEISLRPHQLKK